MPLLKKLKKKKTKNTSGYDEIFNRIIKSSSAYIISPLVFVIRYLVLEYFQRD
jgi:hypothetical protein